jgi:hypothetical protein
MSRHMLLGVVFTGCTASAATSPWLENRHESDVRQLALEADTDLERARETAHAIRLRGSGALGLDHAGLRDKYRELCERGYMRACRIVLSFDIGADSSVAEPAAVIQARAQCARGDRPSCLALPRENGNAAALPGRWGRSRGCFYRDDACSDDALVQECGEGFPLSCRSLIVDGERRRATIQAALPRLREECADYIRRACDMLWVAGTREDRLQAQEIECIFLEGLECFRPE